MINGYVVYGLYYSQKFEGHVQNLCKNSVTVNVYSKNEQTVFSH